MVKSYSVSFLILLCFTLIETAILSNITILPALPDFLLMSVMFFSLLNGKTYGESQGFISGLILDFLSGAPFGFNCIFRTLIGYLCGFLHGSVNFTGFLFPMLFGAGGTIVKAFFIWMISLFYPSQVLSYTVLSVPFLCELILNTVLTPFIFKLLNVFSKMVSLNKEEII